MLPLAVKLGQGCLACEVFKVLYFSADSQLVDLTAGRKLEIETMKLLNRPDPHWLSLEEYYASLVVFRACMRYMVRAASLKVRTRIRRATQLKYYLLWNLFL